MLDSFTSKLFRYQEEVTVEIDVPGLYQCSFYNLQSSAVDNVSIIMYGFLPFRIRLLFTPMLK